MAELDLLDQVLAYFRNNVEDVEFRRAYDPSWGTRLLERPLVSGEVAAWRQEGQVQETTLRFSLFAPKEQQGEELLLTLWNLVADHFPSCCRLERESGKTDDITRLRYLGFQAIFLGGEENGQGVSLLLEGKSYSVAETSVSVHLTGNDLVAVGEEVPFGREGARLEYQVELEGLDTQGLERLTVFTAELGSGVYTGCRWKSLDLAGGKGIFLASGWQEKGE